MNCIEMNKNVENPLATFSSILCTFGWLGILTPEHASVSLQVYADVNLSRDVVGTSVLQVRACVPGLKRTEKHQVT